MSGILGICDHVYKVLGYCATPNLLVCGLSASFLSVLVRV